RHLGARPGRREVVRSGVGQLDGSRGERPVGPTPAARDLLRVLEQRAVLLHRTSESISGGHFIAVIRGDVPTVSAAMSSASPSVVAVRNPSRDTVLRSPPTKITSPR